VKYVAWLTLGFSASSNPSVVCKCWIERGVKEETWRLHLYIIQENQTPLARKPGCNGNILKTNTRAVFLKL
jgi:hypothetical protein